MTKFKLTNVLQLIRTALGRRKLIIQLHHSALPVLAWTATFYRRILSRTRVITVVGSYGKTTTTRSIAHVLGLTYPNDFAGGYLARNLLSLRRSDRQAVFEVGIDGLDQMGRLARMFQPEIAVVTSIGMEHHHKLINLENTRNEKAWMVRVLPSTGLAILNGDDPNVRWMAQETKAQVLFIGFEDGNDIQITDSVLDWPKGRQITLQENGTRHSFRTGLIGRHFSFAAAAAFAVARAEKVSLQDFSQRIETLRPVSGRLELIQLPNDNILVRDDLKSSLETIDASLDILDEIPVSRKILVIGDIAKPPGNIKHHYRRIGKRIAEVTDMAIFVGEYSGEYAVGAKLGGLQDDHLFDAGKHWSEAMQILRRILRSGDLILIKGGDRQRLERMSLVLQGKETTCSLTVCRGVCPCRQCPELVR